jgi:hypothetical protein
MAFSSSLLQQRLKLFALCVYLLVPVLASAASDSARVISTQPERSASKPVVSGKAAPEKAAPEKSAVVALINLEEVLPDC